MASEGEIDAALIISILSFVVSGWALFQTQANHRKAMRREEFASHRAAVEKAKGDLGTLLKGLERVAEPTVPLVALAQGFDFEYVNVDAALNELDDACVEIDRSQLFGGGWEFGIQEHRLAWDSEFDCVANATRSEAERRAAAVRSIGALRAIVAYVTLRTRDVVKDHAS